MKGSHPMSPELKSFIQTYTISLDDYMQFCIELDETGEKIFEKMQRPSTKCIFAHDEKCERVTPIYGYDVFKAAITHNRFMEFYPGSFVIATCDWDNTDREELALLTKIAKGS